MATAVPENTPCHHRCFATEIVNQTVLRSGVSHCFHSGD
jgi:hypothetical protein